MEGEITVIGEQKITVKDSKGKSSTVTEARGTEYKVGETYKKAGTLPFVSLVCTFCFALLPMSLRAIALGANLPRFALRTLTADEAEANLELLKTMAARVEEEGPLPGVTKQ